MKRILDCQSSDFQNMSRDELLSAIAGSEGRTIACETIGSIMPMLGDITNAEFVAAMGADILLLNMFDVQNPRIQGLPKTDPENIIWKLKELTGRPIGINLEPVEQVLSSEDPSENMWAMTHGRKATLENAKKAAAMGVNFILLTGNPGIGVTNEAIEQTLAIYKEALGDQLILAAGKMHASGVLKEGAQAIHMEGDGHILHQINENRRFGAAVDQRIQHDQRGGDCHALRRPFPPFAGFRLHSQHREPEYDRQKDRKAKHSILSLQDS